MQLLVFSSSTTARLMPAIQLFLLICLSILGGCIMLKPNIEIKKAELQQMLRNVEKNKGGKYDEYMLTRIYPAAVCRADDDAVPDSCEIPPGTETWSVHGLWPERTDGSYPQFCDGNPKKFDPDLIVDIQKTLESSWPNLFPTKKATDFWKHEYEKHGTCAQRDSKFGTEKLYFTSTMEMNKKFDVGAALKAGGIVPRNEPYDTEEVQQALNTHLGQGKYVQLHCLTDRMTKQTLLADTRLCLNLQWEPVDCPKKGKAVPVVEIQDERIPLPSFNPCHGKIVFLSPNSIVKEDPSYNEYMLTQIYPTAVCRADDDSVPDSCEIPDGTPRWSVHGLWPERSDGTWPQFCAGKPRKFDPSLIAPIENVLERVWPNLYPAKSAHDFWKHEYEKHGTCAQIDERFKTELMYFNGTMDIYHQFDVDAALQAGSILPREQPYHVDEIQKAVNDHLGQGKYVQINCLTDRKTKKQLLGDTRLCLNRKFEPVDCPKETRVKSFNDYPLPNFKGLVIYMALENLPMFVMDPDDSEVFFLMHPLANFLPRLLPESPVYLLFLALCCGVVAKYAFYKYMKTRCPDLLMENP